MKITNSQVDILTLLLSASKGLYPYTIHSKLNLSPKDIYEAIERLKKLELIVVQDDRIAITDKGLTYIFSYSKKHQDVTKKNKYFSGGEKIEKNSFYVPTNF